MSYQSNGVEDELLLDAYKAGAEQDERSELQRLRRLLEGQSAETLSHALKFGRRQLQSSVSERFAAGGWCSTLAPVFFFESPPLSESSGGKITRFSRADSDARTLEVGAATGEFASERYPSSEQFILGFNRASATIGASVRLGRHAGASLEVSVELEILAWPDEPGATSTGSGSELLFVFAENSDLPLGGAVAAWCRASLRLVGNEGPGSTVGTEISSAWVNRGVSEITDNAENGSVLLTHRIALDPQLARAGIFVTLSCFVGAEESENAGYSTFAEMHCFPGAWPPFIPHLIRLRSINARVCEPGLAPRVARGL